MCVCSIQKTKIMASSPITSRQIDGETMETVREFILGGSKITADGDCSHEDLLNPGIKPRSPALQVDSLLAELPGKPQSDR